MKIFGQFCLVYFCTFILKLIHLIILGSTILGLLKQLRVWKQDQIELTPEALSKASHISPSKIQTDRVEMEQRTGNRLPVWVQC